MSARRPVQRSMTTPYYVVVWGRTRLLMWGLFDTKAQAEARALDEPEPARAEPEVVSSADWPYPTN